MELMKQGQVSSMALTFNKEALGKEILFAIKEEFLRVKDEWKREVESKMKFKEFKDNAETDIEVIKRANAVIVYLEANTYVLADSYGTGSLMLSNNPGFRKYIMQDPSLNPARTGKAIAGRGEGDYVNVFGQKRHSTGNLKGVNLEGLSFFSADRKEKYTIQPVAPSRAVEIAEMYVYGTFLPAAYKRAIQKVNFAKFLIES